MSFKRSDAVYKPTAHTHTYTSNLDNGGPAAGINKNQASNWPLRGMKYILLEGGVRGAAFLWSPLLKKSGYILSNLLQIEDMFPNLLHAAGDNTRLLSHDVSSKDMWQVLSTDGPSSRKKVFHKSNPGNNVKAMSAAVKME